MCGAEVVVFTSTSRVVDSGWRGSKLKTFRRDYRIAMAASSEIGLSISTLCLPAVAKAIACLAISWLWTSANWISIWPARKAAA